MPHIHRVSTIFHRLHDPIWGLVGYYNVYSDLSLHEVLCAAKKKVNAGNWVVAHEIFTDVCDTFFVLNMILIILPLPLIVLFYILTMINYTVLT